MTPSHRARSLAGFRELLAWCRDNPSPGLERLVNRGELDALVSVFAGERPFEPAAYAHLFNLSQALPGLARPESLAAITVGDALEGLRLLPRAHAVDPLEYEYRPNETALRKLGHHENAVRLDRARDANLPGWQPHADQHRRMVMDAVDGLLGRGGMARRIAYLGAARTYDVPLAELAARCGGLILVDVDGPALYETAARQPAELAAKLRPHIVDLTGLGAPLVRAVDDLLSTNRDPARAASALATLLMSCLPASQPDLPIPAWTPAAATPTPAPAPPDDVDLVISGMVLSQVSHALAAYPRRAFLETFPAHAALFDRGPCAAALAFFPVQVQSEHVAALARRAPNIVLSSDVAEETITGNATGDLVPSGRERPTIGARELRQIVPHWLRPTAAASSWDWYRELPRQVGGTGTRLRVEMLALVGT